MSQLSLVLDSNSLAMTSEVVASMSREARAARLDRLIDDARKIASSAIETHITAQGKRLAAIVVLFSGGDDSTVLAHLFRKTATHAGHAHTGIGIEQTREFVRATCRSWGLPLVEKRAPHEEDSYRACVLAEGFPGPGMHYKMWQRLKERGIRAINKELVGNPRRSRVLYLSGRRRDESERRAKIAMADVEGSRVNCAPMVNWTKPDFTTYRRRFHDCPQNPVAALIHMSGECLCGSFAGTNERAEIEAWFPEPFREIDALEREIADRDDLPRHVKKWGWGGDPNAPREEPQAGGLCGACKYRGPTLFDAEERRAAGVG